MPANLYVRTGPNSGEVHAIAGPSATIGRGADCEVCLAGDAHASRQHCRIELRGGAYWLVDLGSKNRTAVNGLPVDEKELRFGDDIRLGLSHLVFLAGSEPAAAIPSDTQAARRTRTQVAYGARYEMVGSGEAMRRVYAVIEKAAPLDVTVLVTGESGTGKELVAGAVHQNSPRCDGPLVAVNCAAIPGELVESELFGHEKGAFTGAAARRQGRFEQAHEGTLFLDEIGDLPAASQAKLLRVLEDKKVTRVGGAEPVAVDVRIVAATNRDLRAEADAGRFRQDLLFRLEVVRVDLPPLRSRSEDIPELAAFFLDRYRAKAGRRVEGLSPAAVEKLLSYDWPGNIRELKNVLERAVILGSGTRIEAEEILLREAAAKPEHVETLAEVEKRQIERAMTLAGGNKKRAAEILGIPRSSLYNRLKEYGLG
ncbi:MAG: sigma 54-interacting transcriptional regulator [Planctomycetota bacterium]|jgi:DNA-binding NtrC family response regulator